MYSEAEGTAAVHLARWAVEDHLTEAARSKPSLSEAFAERRGTFVTLETYPDRLLRGCIGYPEATHPLEEAITQAAVSACHDPRFPPLAPEELPGVVVEVSLLTPARRLAVDSPLDLPGEVVVGRDGLLVRRGRSGGLLLPQVPVDGRWDAEEFLSQACMKAGLLPDAWFEPTVEIYAFQAEVFAEGAPGKAVARRELTAVHEGH